MEGHEGQSCIKAGGSAMIAEGTPSSRKASMARKWIGLAILWVVFLMAVSWLSRELPAQPRFTLPSSTIFFFRLSPDSRSLATLEVDDRYNYGDELGPQRRGPARLWDIGTGRESGVFGAEEKITDLIFSPDGKLLALKKELKGYYDFDFYDLETRQKRTTIRADTRGRYLDPEFCFSPDGRNFVFETVDKNGVHIKSRDLSTQQEKFMLNEIGPITFSPSGKTMAVLPKYQHMVILVDTETGQQKHKLKIFDGFAWELMFSSDGKMLAATIERGHLSNSSHPATHLWEVETGRQLITLDRRSHPIFLGDGQTLLTRKQKGIFEKGMELELWEISTGRELGAITVLPESKNCGGPIPVPGTDLVAIYGSHETEPNVVVEWLKRFFHAGAPGSSETWNEIKLLNPINGREEFSFVQEGPWIYDLKISPNGKWLATRAQTFKDKVITVWDIPSRRPATWIIGVLAIPSVLTLVVIWRSLRIRQRQLF
jgi:WD40 repeat protein